MGHENFNACAQLFNETDVAKAQSMYTNALENGVSPFQQLMDMQEGTQNYFSVKNPHIPRIDSLQTIGQKVEWMKMQDLFIQDENVELLTALGGMSTPKPKGAWKPWVKGHVELREKKFEDLSEADQLEAKFELIDALHFQINKMLALGMTDEEIFVLYTLKNLENIERQNNGY
ncbi:MAG: dCTP pyrophosphatase [Alphaproteobacteria bacterium]